MIMKALKQLKLDIIELLKIKNKKFFSNIINYQLIFKINLIDHNKHKYYKECLKFYEL